MVVCRVCKRQSGNKRFLLKNLFLISNLNLPIHNFRPLNGVLSLVTREEISVCPSSSSHEEGVDCNVCKKTSLVLANAAILSSLLYNEVIVSSCSNTFEKGNCEALWSFNPVIKPHFRVLGSCWYDIKELNVPSTVNSLQLLSCLSGTQPVFPTPF